MSGGSYNYLCYASIDELLNKHGQDLDDMVQGLSAVGATDAARETESLRLILRHFEVRMQARLDRLSPVWKALEWWHSGDTSEKQFEEALADYRREVEPPTSQVSSEDRQ